MNAAWRSARVPAESTFGAQRIYAGNIRSILSLVARLSRPVERSHKAPARRFRDELEDRHAAISAESRYAQVCAHDGILHEFSCRAASR
jgi:hypothetical protein